MKKKDNPNDRLIRYDNIVDLVSFLGRCEEKLFDSKSRQMIDYTGVTSKCWDANEISNSNTELLKQISVSACVYAIFISGGNCDNESLAYIGQTCCRGARTRIRNHLIIKGKGTGAQLEKVKTHVLDGGTIKISWVHIFPVSLRHYVEEELIKKYKQSLIWNKYGKRIQ